MANKNDYQSNPELTLANIRCHFDEFVNYDKHPGLHPESRPGHPRLPCIRVMRALAALGKEEKEVERLKARLGKWEERWEKADRCYLDLENERVLTGWDGWTDDDVELGDIDDTPGDGFTARIVAEPSGKEKP